MRQDMRRRDGLDTASIPWVNGILIAANVAVFCIGLLAGALGRDSSFLYREGALYAPLLLKGKDFHRLLTAVFLHADAAHLANNMIVQFAGGNIVEKNLGHMRYAALYLVSGAAGNAVSVLVDYVTGEYGFSVGASGAVFGIIGALLFMILREARSLSMARTPRRTAENAENTGNTEPAGRGTFAPPAAVRSLLIRAGVMTAWLLYSGWSNPMINQAAHAGGMACGFALTALMMIGRPRADLETLYR